jgi:C4-dicarboxylate-specific signal transduction histidine kinase
MDYEDLERKYKELEINSTNLKKELEQVNKKYKKLDSRFYSILKMNDRTLKKFFNREIKTEEIKKRFKIVLKQSDKQSKKLLIAKENKEQLLLEQSKMASMGEMIENITHQMKQPLSLISLSATTIELKKELNILDDKEFISLNSSIIDATKYLTETIDNFRNFFSNNKQETQISLSSIIEQSKNLLYSKFKNQDIFIVKDFNEIILIGIENDLIQVFTNLFSNSIDALENKKGEKVIVISAYLKHNQTIIEFTDSAGGVDENIINKIFKSHFTTKKRKNGTGIGLYMTKKILQNNLNGNISIKNKDFSYNNKDYKGASFKINFINKEKEEDSK